MLKTWLVESRFLGRVRTKRPLTRPDKSGHPLPLGEGWRFSAFSTLSLGERVAKPRSGRAG